MKTFKRLRKFVNEEIKAGDTVKITDGSYLCCDEYPEKDFFIVYAYSEAGEDLKYTKLEDINCMVLETGVNDYVCVYLSAYLLDVKIKCGNLTFRTCSQFLRKV